MDNDAETAPAMPRNILKPYASVIVLICPDGTDPESVFSQVIAKLQSIRKLNSSRSSVAVVREGLETGDGGTASISLSGFDQVAATVHRVESRPSWLKESIFSDIQHELTVTFRRGRLIAVHLPRSVRDSFQRWLDKPPLPMVRRVSSDILEQALLSGEARGLWLRGTHSPRKTMADSKNIVGPDLRQTLSATEDQTYALNSARSMLPTTPSRVALTGTVGTTPTRSLVWNKATDDFDEFAQCCLELLTLLAETIELDPSTFTPAFNLLTQPVFDFANVFGAYDISCANPIELPDGTDDAKIGAACTLESSFMVIHGREDSAAFELEIGQGMRIGGRMRGSVRVVDGTAQLSLGLLGEPTDPTIALPVRNALQYSDLLTVYYASGHTFTHGTLYKPQAISRPFPNWEWHDFTAYSVAKEKPGASNSSPAEIHAKIGEDGDRSLFSWVKEYFTAGWLTCDDGSGELADFIHVDPDDFTLSFIHVKGAENDSALRGVSATAYEVVTSQAVKNTYFMNDEILGKHLKSSPVAKPATWADGLREIDRSGLIEAIEARDARSGHRVVIVQPHMKKDVYDKQHKRAKVDSNPSADLLRLRRLENILNGGRPSMTGMGADLFVFGSLT